MLVPLFLRGLALLALVSGFQFFLSGFRSSFRFLFQNFRCFLGLACYFGLLLAPLSFLLLSIPLFPSLLLSGDLFLL